MRRFTRPAPPLPTSLFLFLFLLLVLLPLPSPLACPKDHRPTVKTSNVSPMSTLVPGFAVCTYYGSLDGTDSLKVLSPDWMPAECTSYFYDGLTIDKTYFIKGTYAEADDDNIQSLGQAGNPVYVYYGRRNYKEWLNYLCTDGQNPQTEIKTLTDYLSTVNIQGIILKNIDLPLGDNPDPAFSGNLKNYLNALRTALPNLKTAMFLPATHIIEYENCATNHTPWFNFPDLNPSVDFYVVGFQNFNPCMDNMKTGGIVPLKGNMPNTLEKLKCSVKASKMDRKKVYYEYSSNPVSCDKTSHLKLTYRTICTNSSISSSWCADNSTTYRLKGDFAKKNAVGFVMTSVDRNDPSNKCQCQDGFPSFHAVLDGWNGATQSPACPLFDRSSQST